MEHFENKVVVVTGSAHSIGKCVCEEFAKLFMPYFAPGATQQPVGRVGEPRDIANMVLFLCSEKAGFIIGENICIDGGMTKLMIYHDDYGWKLEK